MKLNILFLSVASLNVNAFCFEEAGRYYDVSPTLLTSIAMVESNLQADAVNENRNKRGEVVSVDYGLMQINSTWFSRLSRFGVSKDNLLNDACFNVYIGAWVLSQNFASHGYNWNSIGAYNAGFSAKNAAARARYIRKVQAALASL